MFCIVFTAVCLLIALIKTIVIPRHRDLRPRRRTVRHDHVTRGRWRHQSAAAAVMTWSLLYHLPRSAVAAGLAPCCCYVAVRRADRECEIPPSRSTDHVMPTTRHSINRPSNNNHVQEWRVVYNKSVTANIRSKHNAKYLKKLIRDETLSEAVMF